MSNNQNASNAVLELVSEKDFRDGVMPRAQLSMLASQMAVDKGTRENVKQFAGWELMEAKAVINALKDMGTTVPPMAKEAKAFLEKLENLDGVQFDKEYMQAEQANHEFLRNLAQNYLDGVDGKASASEKQIWHVANLALFAFTEHVGLTSKINAELHA